MSTLAATPASAVAAPGCVPWRTVYDGISVIPMIEISSMGNRLCRPSAIMRSPGATAALPSARHPAVRPGFTDDENRIEYGRGAAV